MINNKKKLTTAIVLGLFVFAFTANTSLAAFNVRINGNGSDSENRVRINSDYKLNVSQSNRADFNNKINVSSNTGGNDANRNNRGDVSIHTGNSNTSVEVSNQANLNHIYLSHSNDGSGNGGNGDNGHKEYKKFHVSMNGAQEVPGPGDPNGWGMAKVAVIPSMGKLCIAMHVGNIEPATAAHIHEAPVGVSGPVVINLPTPDSNGHAKGCVDADSNKLTEIKNNPSNFYVNVHNGPYPNGAVRGQLSN